jgi:hypothetical protein
MQKRTWKYGLILISLILMLAACGQDSQAPAEAPFISETALPAQPPDPIDSAPSPTALVAPTATLNTAPPPTIAPPPTSTSAPAAVVDSAPSLLVTDFGTDRNPLTGELVADPALLDRRPLAIKISNAPPQWVRPQSGLNDADIVFEHVTEGALTRFTLLVYGKTPADVGPIRSARMIDLELPAMYDAALFYSGSSEGVKQRLFSSDFQSRVMQGFERGFYRTEADKPYEHTLYGNPATFWEVLEEKGLNSRPNFTTFMSFSEEAPPGGTLASGFTVNYLTTLPDWRYDPITGRYLRWTDGEPHLDGYTLEQVSAANVVVIHAYHADDPTICEQIGDGVCLALSVQAQIWGSGPVTIFRDGQRYDGTWQRTNRNDMFTFYDAAGQPIPLQIGNSWFQVIPTSYENPVTVTP